MEPGKKRTKKIWVFLFTLICLITSLLVLLYMPIFNISFIKVKGNTKYSADELIQASGILIGENGFKKLRFNNESIFELRLTDSEKNIESLPYVKQCKVSLVFPDGVMIEISEREQEAYISYLDNFLLVDRDGYVLEVTDSRPESYIKEIRGIEFLKYSVGNQLEDTDTDLVKTAVEIIEAIKESDKNSKLKLFDVLDWVDMIDKYNALLSLDNRVMVRFNPKDKLQYTIDFTKEIFFKKLNSKETGRIVFSEGQNSSFIPE
ncbi:MAG: FtsQ-type POTRA domain-containing protein [Clostridiaceae bacterium]|nr:FtsQ-type POTRA domain-containing protein [Clostridiaceae bacterium]